MLKSWEGELETELEKVKLETKLDVEAHTVITALGEAEAGGSQIHVTWAI